MPKIKNRNIFLIILLAIAIAGVYFLFLTSKPSEVWSVAPDGTISYPQNRGSVQYQEILLNDTENFTLSKIIYESKGEKIYALLLVPKTGNEKVTALVMLPGALVTKEGQQGNAEFFREHGFATLTLDERGNRGETAGGISGLEEEYFSFVNNREPVSHKMVFDALRAFDILRERNGIDKNNIGIYGESMGGRYAIISAAIEPRIKFLIGVSTSGYGSGRQLFNDANVARFYASIDPDSYIGRISPRKIIMVHAAQDKTVPIEMAKSTFSYANGPKKFIEVNSACHGLCDDMSPLLAEELKSYG